MIWYSDLTLLRDRVCLVGALDGPDRGEVGAGGGRRRRRGQADRTARHTLRLFHIMHRTL